MDSFKNKEAGKHWIKLRTILKSKNRLNLLNRFKSIETNVFLKNFETKEECLYYKGVNPNLELYLFREGNHSQTDAKNNRRNINFNIKVVKPLDFSTQDDLQKFSKETIDNTGNLQLWPCEEILTFFCLSNLSIFEGKKIIELGSGYSGLCCLFLASNLQEIGEILITDGNLQSVEGIKSNLKLNQLDEFRVKADTLKWSRNSLCINKDYYKKYDFVLISDCLFFEKFHDDLVFTIDYILAEMGRCIIVSPERGSTMSDFLVKASKIFQIKRSQEELKFYEYLDNHNSINTNNQKFVPIYIELTHI